ncbi:MAG: sulfotransferase [Steroidobacteraceae bacterium]
MSRASAFRQQGRWDEAIDAYRRLLAVRPGLPDSWYNLGWSLRQAGRPEEALTAYAKSLALGVSSPEEVHVNRAAIYSDLMARPDAARVELEQALRLNPAYLPALLNLGNLAEDLGDAAAARDSYESALRIAPQDARVLSRLAGLAKATDADDPMIVRLEAALRSRAHAPDDAAQLLFALGRLYDGCGAYDRAYAAFEAANAQALNAAGGVLRYDATEEARRADALADAYGCPAAPGDGISASDVRPVFILGAFRSGSSLLEQILSSHSAIRAGGELTELPRIARSLGGDARAQASAAEPVIREHAESYLARLRVLHPGACLVTDKRPDNFWHVGLIRRMFPDARIVNTRRHALDNLVSIWALHLDASMAYGYRPEDIAGHLQAERRMMAHWNRLYPDRILTVDYEALVREPVAAIGRVLDFLGLPFEAACLDFHRSARPVRTASVWQVREPLHDRSIGRWRHYAGALRARRDGGALGALLAEAGA